MKKLILLYQDYEKKLSLVRLLLEEFKKKDRIKSIS